MGKQLRIQLNSANGKEMKNETYQGKLTDKANETQQEHTQNKRER